MKTLPARKVLGYQIIATLKVDDAEILKNERKMHDMFEEFATALTVLSHSIYKFPGVNSGCTGVLLIAESHIAYHTWPEFNTITIDIFTCASKEITMQVFNKILENFKPNDYIYQFNIRTTVD